MKLIGVEIRRRFLLGVGVIVVTACFPASQEDTGPSDTGFAFAYFHDDCAPWDGHALTFLFSHVESSSPFDVSYPHVRVTSWRPPPGLPGATIEWDGTDDRGRRVSSGVYFYRLTAGYYDRTRKMVLLK